jgi:hypothetical protein
MNRTNPHGNDLIEHVHDLFAPANKVADLDLISFENVIQVVTEAQRCTARGKLR